MQAGQLDLAFLGYDSYWNYAEKKGYSGTAIYTKHKPLSVRYGIGIEEHDHEGRVITLEYEDFFFITVYVPNAQDGLKRLDYRMKWEDDFLSYIKELDKQKPVIFCGDLNVAHEEIDLKNPKTNHNNPGLQTKNAKNSPHFCNPVSRTLSERCILMTPHIHGGHTVFMHAKRT